MKFILLRAPLVVACLVLIGCQRRPVSGTASRSANPSSSPGQTAPPTPGSAKPGLPNFAVQPVRTEEGTAQWYDVPDNSLAARRAWPEEMTAASDTLPQNAYVRVTPLAPEKNGGTGQPVVVRVTDNGVHKKGVLIEVDRDAARALGIVKAGEAKVRVEVLSLQNATADKPVDRKDASVLPKTSQLTGTPAAGRQAEEDAAKAKGSGSMPER